MIKFSRLTNSTRDKMRPPLMGLLPDAALLAQIPQVRKNKPTRKPASTPLPTPVPGGTSSKAAGSPIPAKPAANGHTQDRANAHSSPATWRKNTPQPGRMQQQNGKTSLPSSPPDHARPSAPQNGKAQQPDQAEPSQNTQKGPNTPSIRSSRLAPGPNRNKLFTDRPVPGVRSVPELPTPDRPDPPRAGSPTDEKPLPPKGPGRKTPGQNGNASSGKETDSPRATSTPSPMTGADARKTFLPRLPSAGAQQEQGVRKPDPAASDLRPPRLPTQGPAEPKKVPPPAVPTVPDRENSPVPPAEKAAPKPAPKEAAQNQALEQLLARHPDLPAQTAVLGVCDDGLPVLFDLLDPAPGAMAIIGDEREVQLEILRSIISSTAARNTPRGVQFLILSIQPETWQQWIAERGYDRYCLAITGVSDDAVREWTLRMADWTEQRRLGQRSGPPVLMIMDTLSFLPKMAYDVRLNFDWLAKEGPPAAIWPLAAISSELALALGSRMLRGFQSRILGYANNPSAYTQLANVTEEQAANLRSPGSYAVQLGENWLCFHLP